MILFISKVSILNSKVNFLLMLLQPSILSLLINKHLKNKLMDGDNYNYKCVEFHHIGLTQAWLDIKISLKKLAQANLIKLKIKIK